MFGSPENRHIVAWILTRKLYEYLDESNISVEVSDGEVMLDAHLPPADVVDRCDTTLKVRSTPLDAELIFVPTGLDWVH